MAAGDDTVAQHQAVLRSAVLRNDLPVVQAQLSLLSEAPQLDLLASACQSLLARSGSGILNGWEALTPEGLPLGFAEALLEVLLAHRATRAALTAATAATEEQQPAHLGAACAASRALVMLAWAARGDLVDRLIAAGAHVGMATITLAFPGNDHTGLLRHRGDAVAGVQALLARAAPAVPADGAASILACPIYAVLQSHQDLVGDATEPVAERRDKAWRPEYQDVGWFLEEMEDRHLDFLQIMEAFVAQGYRPAVFRSVRQAPGSQALLLNYDPAAGREARRWQLDGMRRWLWRAALAEPWTPAAHARFPPAFRAAARTLLLAAHRGSRQEQEPEGSDSAGSGSSSWWRLVTAARLCRCPAALQRSEEAGALGRLPSELVYKIIEAAAYPLSAWKPRMGVSFEELESDSLASWSFRLNL